MDIGAPMSGMLSGNSIDIAAEVSLQHSGSGYATNVTEAEASAGRTQCATEHWITGKCNSQVTLLRHSLNKTAPPSTEEPGTIQMMQR